MRTAKPGPWWLLAQTMTDGATFPVYWDGTWTRGSIGSPVTRVPCFVMDKHHAVQFDSEGAARHAIALFSLPADLRPVERLFAAPAVISVDLVIDIRLLTTLRGVIGKRLGQHRRWVRDHGVQLAEKQAERVSCARQDAELTDLAALIDKALQV
jgi:hypothetical protein